MQKKINTTAKPLITPKDFEEQLNLAELETQMSTLKFLLKNMSEYQKEFLRSKLYTFDELLDFLPEKDWPLYFKERKEILERYQEMTPGKTYMRFRNDSNGEFPFSLDYINHLYRDEYVAILEREVSFTEIMGLRNYGIETGRNICIRYEVKNIEKEYKFLIDTIGKNLIWFKESWIEHTKFSDSTSFDGSKIVNTLKCNINVGSIEPNIGIQYEKSAEDKIAVSKYNVPKWIPFNSLELIFRLDSGNLIKYDPPQCNVY